MNPSTNVRVALRFVRLAINLLIAFCENVVGMLTDNANFPDPFPELTEVKSAIAALKAAALAAMDGGRMAIAARKQRKEELLELMRPLASWVQAHCQNSLEIFTTSGFIAVRSRTLVGTLSAPDAPRLKQGPDTGTLAARTRLLHGAYTYCHRIALASAPNVYLQVAVTTTVKHTFENLIPGQIYRVDVCGIGAAGEGAYSPAVSHMVI